MPSTPSPAPSSASEGPPSKRRRTTSLDSEEPRVLKVYIVQAKFDTDTITELYRLVESCAPGDQFENTEDDDAPLHLELYPEVEDADIIITAIHMKRRFERHVNWDIARQKAIVTQDWLRDSIRAGHALPCGNYAAISELHDQTVEHCPDPEQCYDVTHRHHQLGSPSRATSKPVSSASAQTLPYLTPSPAAEPTDPRVFNNWRARYACQRASPLVCPNQGLVAELGVLCRDRELEALSPNALAYQRAIAVIKSYPNVIDRSNFETAIVKLPGMGPKIVFKVEEYLLKGYVSESQTTLSSERYQALSAFASIHGIGPSKAREFYDMGMRTIEDLDVYYDISPGITPAGVEQQLAAIEEGETYTPNGKRIKSRRGKLVKAPDITIPVALALRGELNVPIPREEAEEMRDVIMRELGEIQLGCVSTIAGGYRRGKPMSNDVDIVISHTDWGRGGELIKGLCTKVVARLYQKGLITHITHLSGFHRHNALRSEHWDSLEKALTVFRLPSTPSTPRLHRRLDLIFASPRSYWTAVVGWTGSKMFQRDLRLWAKQEKGMKFDSMGLIRRHDTKLFLPRSEREIFEILGLDWIDPTMRNADQ